MPEIIMLIGCLLIAILFLFLISCLMDRINKSLETRIEQLEKQNEELTNLLEKRIEK